MSHVLYRKYRPQNFSEVIGQDIVKTILKNAVRENRVSHAYLFTGPRGVGKTTLARILAKAVNCLAPKDGEPDTTCENCVQIAEGRFLDLFEIDAASYTGVDNMREIIDHVKFAPNKGKFKVFIIDEVHMLSKWAFNALLKTLEEPPAHAIFILATTEVFRVPATIISRTQRFDFKAVSILEILKLFEKISADLNIKIPLEAQKLIAQGAGGSFRDALSILDQVMSFSGDKISLEEVEDILGMARIDVSQRLLSLIMDEQRNEAVKFIKDLALEGRDLVQFSKSFLEYLRMVLFVKMDAANLEEIGLIADDQEKLLAQSKIPGGKLLEIIKKTLEAHREMKQSPVQELPFLTAVLALFPEESAPASPRLSSPSPRSLGEAGTSGEEVKEGGSLDLGKIIDSWASVLAKVKEYNHSLISSLRLGRIVKLEGQDLVLAFPYSFHKETIEARKNRIVVEQVLEETFNQKLKVKVYLERELNGQAPSDLLSEAVKVLGNDNE